VTVDNLLDKLEALPDWQKYGAVGGVVLLMLLAFWYFAWSPNSEEITRLDNRIKELDAEINKGEAYKAQERELAGELASLERQLEYAMEFLPDQQAMDKFIKTIENLAVEAELTVDRFLPRNPVNKGFHFEVPVELGVRGDYHAVGRFFEKLANEKRIVNAYSLVMHGIQQRPFTLNATIILHALYFPSQ
jgi:type IV pilus assembly protein PilO